MQDVFFILEWWFALLCIGIVFFPLTSRLFSAFYDKGYIFSKIVGTALSCYVIFFLSSFHILPFTHITIYLVFILFLIVNCILLLKQNRTKPSKRLIILIISEEILYIAALSFWAYIRGHEPSLHSLEKFMDFGFINSALRTQYLPPPDMWFANFTINYYYFGHFVTAYLTKLTTIPPEVAYNIMLCSLFALTFVSTFSIGINLVRGEFFKKRHIVTGILASLFVTLGGNLHTIYSFFASYKTDHPVPPWQLKLSLFSVFPNGTINILFANNYWYANATRFIPFTIHEFPLYSFVVADLHGHVTDIPFVLLTIAVLFSLFLSEKIKLTHLVFISLLISIMYMTNVWDGVIYFLLAACILSVLTFKMRDPYYLIEIKNLFSLENFALQKNLFVHTNFAMKNKIKNSLHPPADGSNFKFQLLTWIFSAGIIGGGFILFSLPFSLHFKPFVSGIGIVCAPDFLFKKDPSTHKALTTTLGPFLFEPDHCQRSAWWELLILYGFFYFFAVSFVVYIFRGSFKSTILSGSSFLLSVLRLQSLRKLVHRTGKQLAKTDKPLSDHHIHSVRFILLLIGLSSILIILPEFFYAKDIYPAHYRANTMFKLVYQAFIMLGIVAAFVIPLLYSSLKHKLHAFIKGKQVVGFFSIITYFILSSIGIILVLMFPFFAVQSYYGVPSPMASTCTHNVLCIFTNFGKQLSVDFSQYKGLDGQLFLKESYKDDYDAIEWIKTHIKGLPVLLEAQGDSYTDYERISAQTGLPTILGWTVHEWLWRGSYDAPGSSPSQEEREKYPAARIEIVKTIYETLDISKATQLMRKYHVQYVYIGKLEHEKYPNLYEDKFKSLGKIIYQNPEVRIYKIKG